MRGIFNTLLSAARDTFTALDRAHNAPNAGTSYDLVTERAERKCDGALVNADAEFMKLLVFGLFEYLLLIAAQIRMYSVSSVAPVTLVFLGVWYAAAWLIIPPFFVIAALKIARNDEPFSITRTAIIAVITLAVLAGLFALAVPMPGFVLFLVLPATVAICAPTLGMMALNRIKARYHQFLIRTMLVGIIVIAAGWAWTITMPDGLDAFSEYQREHAEEALRVVSSQCILLGFPDDIDWGISAGESKWRVTEIDSLGDGQYRATVQFYTWMRIPTYAITVPGCSRVSEEEIQRLPPAPP